MNEVIRAAGELRDVCDGHGWRYCFIGGLAVLRWGEPRETVDVDATLLTGFSDESRYVATLMAAFQPRRDDAAEFARLHRVLLLRASSGVGLDIALGGLPFEESAVDLLCPAPAIASAGRSRLAASNVSTCSGNPSADCARSRSTRGQVAPGRPASEEAEQAETISRRGGLRRGQSSAEGRRGVSRCARPIELDSQSRIPAGQGG